MILTTFIFNQFYSYFYINIFLLLPPNYFPFLFLPIYLPMSNSSQSVMENETSIEDKSIFPDFVDKMMEVQTEGYVLQGILRSIDGYLNCVLENVKIVAQTEPQESINLKTCFLRGITIKHINTLTSN